MKMEEGVRAVALIIAKEHGEDRFDREWIEEIAAEAIYKYLENYI